MFKIFSDKNSLMNCVQQGVSVKIIKTPHTSCLVPPLEIFIKNNLFKEMFFKVLV